MCADTQTQGQQPACWGTAHSSVRARAWAVSAARWCEVRLEGHAGLCGAGSCRLDQGPSSCSTGDSEEGLQQRVTNDLLILQSSLCSQCG